MAETFGSGNRVVHFSNGAVEHLYEAFRLLGKERARTLEESGVIDWIGRLLRAVQ
jgi:hypothetical protein